MTWRSPRLWIAVLAATGVLLMALADVGRSAPGPVSGSHALVGDLDGGQSCRQCHGGLLSGMTSSCLGCHEPIAAQLADGSGLHGRLGKERASQCALCHSEHHGADFALVNAMSFAQAGAGDPASFDHGLVGFAMQGRHLDAACEACHVRAHADVLRPGERRFLGLTQRCTACHHDPHGGRMQVSCTTCHGQEAFAELVAEGHEAHLPLTGAHARAACTDCHASGSPHSLDAVGERRAPSVRTCDDCHASPHRAGFVPAPAAAPAPQPASADACAACHLEGDTTFAAAADRLTAAEHARSGFALVHPHDKAACTSCHGERDAEHDIERDAGQAKPFAARHPGRGPDECSACHADPHGGQFAGRAVAAAGCVACHARTHFAPHGFGLDEHARTALPLTGRHAGTDCEKCHLRGSDEQPRRFTGTTNQCDGCHADAHDGFFAAALERHPPVPHGGCAHCHTPATFAEVHPDFDHGTWTGFPLAGSHQQAACEGCHHAAAAPDAHGRRFGRVSAMFPPGTGCARCHDDPHGGAFDGAHLPERVEGRAGCARCHDEVSFRALLPPPAASATPDPEPSSASPQSFDHGFWTGFALDGSHAALSCSACHAPTRAAGGRSLQRAKGRACADCHADPHGGQFTREGRVDCARCHKTGHFKAITFNHNLDARFALGDAHERVACGACHEPEPIAGAVRVRYRPLPRTCVECHGAHEEQLRRRKRKGS